MLGFSWSCRHAGNLGHLRLTSGCSQGGEMNEATPPEDAEASALGHAVRS